MNLSNVNLAFLIDGVFVVLYLFILAGVLYGGFLLFARYVRSSKKKKNALKLTFFLVKIPEANEIEIKVAEQLFASLYSIKRGFFHSLFNEQEHISFEIIGKDTDISFYVVCPNDISELVEKQINASYPSAEIDTVEPPKLFDRGGKVAFTSLQLGGPCFYPIRNYEDLPADGISGITNTMSKLSANELLALQILIKPAGHGWVSAGQKFVSALKYHNSNPEKKQINVDQTFMEGVEKKLARPGFDVQLNIVSVSDDTFKAQSNLRNLAGSFEQFTDVKYNRLKRRSILFKDKFLRDFVYRHFSSNIVFVPLLEMFLYRNSSLLNSTELATIFHLPNKEVKTPRINWLRSKRAPAPHNLPEKGLYLGECAYRGVEKKVHVMTEDRRRHFYIIGQTGTGKSELMKFMAVQDIKAGHGVGFIDPHGSAIDDILLQIPRERMEDVIYFSAGDEERPLGLNILEAETEQQKHILVNSFIGLLYKLYDPNKQGIMGPLLERSIRNVMLTAMEEQGNTMIEVLRLLIDKNFAKSKIPLIKDPLVKKYWTDEVANTSEARKGETMGYFVSKFDRFVTDRLMRNIIGQPKSAFNFRKVMDEKKILLVDLSKGKIGEENSNFIGLIMVPRLLAAALSRADVYGKVDYPDFYLYVDEFQNFSTPDIATILSEARKYKLCMIMANQFIAQLSDDIKTAVFGNVGTVNVFRVGMDDAEYLENQFAPVFEKNDIINLPIGNSYIRLLINGHPSSPFSLRVPWEIIKDLPKDKALAEEIKEHSRMKFGVDRHIVEEDINRRTQG
ncbi:MAG: TraM recognition domain-containing protein [Patescibacteria group bacterium]